MLHNGATSTECSLSLSINEFSDEDGADSNDSDSYDFTLGDSDTVLLGLLVFFFLTAAGSFG